MTKTSPHRDAMAIAADTEATAWRALSPQERQRRKLRALVTNVRHMLHPGYVIMYRQQTGGRELDNATEWLNRAMEVLGGE